MSAYRVPYLVGNTPNRDHPMWPTVTIDYVTTSPLHISLAQVNRQWPTSVNLATAMALFWRIKTLTLNGGTFSFSFNRTFNTHDTGYAYASLTGTIPSSTCSYAPNNSELNLIDSPQWSDLSQFLGLENHGLASVSTTVHAHINGGGAVRYYLDYPASHLDGTVNTQNINMTMNFIMQAYADDSQLVIWDPNTLFRPRLTFTGGFSRSDITVSGGINGIFAIGTWGINPVSLPNNGHISVTIDPVVGPSFSIPVNFQFAFDDAINSTQHYNPQTMALSLSATATEFWPYNNSQGAPVYDSATGAQLVDPFS